MQHTRASEELNSMHSIVMIKKHIEDNNGALKLSKGDKMSLARLVIEANFRVKDVSAAVGIHERNLYKYVKQVQNHKGINPAKGRPRALQSDDIIEAKRFIKKDHL